MPVHARLRGEVRWRVLDDRGVPEIARNPSGFAIAPPEGVTQHNLVTDLGMDDAAAYPIFGADFRNYLAVGTASTAPNVADTTLAAEVQRATTNGTYSGAADPADELDTTDNVARRSTRVTKEITLAADRNLTEFGFSRQASGAIGIRELFRDGVGDPVTISLLEGKIIQVSHLMSGELPWPSAGTAATIDVKEYDASNTLTDTISTGVVSGLHLGNTGAEEDFVITRFFDLWDPSVANTVTAFGGAYRLNRVTAAKTFARQGLFGAADSLPDTQPGHYGATLEVSEQGLEPYVAGTFQRAQRWTIAPAAGEGDWYGALLSYSTTSGAVSIPRRWEYLKSGYLLLWSSPASYAKANTDTMRLGVVSSWARA